MQYDCSGIGNAIVDVHAQHDEAFLESFSLVKGSMELVDERRAVELYEAMNVSAESSGGSAANTMAGIASFGGSAALLGKVADDHLGRVYAAESESTGIAFPVAPGTGGEPTARSMIVVTPDAERTMSTYLGAATTLYDHEIDEAVVANSQVLYCEGYIWDIDVTKTAIRHAIAIAKANDRRISFTLSDSFCVERHFDEWQQLVDDEIDVLFGNEEELASLTGLSDFGAAVEATRGRVEILCATRGSEGSLIVTADETFTIPAVPVADVVDTTGAGDQYAAGVLYGLTHGMDLAACGRLGSIAASEVISHMGARPNRPLSELLP